MTAPKFHSQRTREASQTVHESFLTILLFVFGLLPPLSAAGKEVFPSLVPAFSGLGLAGGANIGQDSSHRRSARSGIPVFFSWISIKSPSSTTRTRPFDSWERYPQFLNAFRSFRGVSSFSWKIRSSART